MAKMLKNKIWDGERIWDHQEKKDPQSMQSISPESEDGAGKPNREDRHQPPTGISHRTTQACGKWAPGPGGLAASLALSASLSGLAPTRASAAVVGELAKQPLPGGGPRAHLRSPVFLAMGQGPCGKPAFRFQRGSPTALKQDAGMHCGAPHGVFMWTQSLSAAAPTTPRTTPCRPCFPQTPPNTALQPTLSRVWD